MEGHIKHTLVVSSYSTILLFCNSVFRVLQTPLKKVKTQTTQPSIN